MAPQPFSRSRGPRLAPEAIDSGGCRLKMGRYFRPVLLSFIKRGTVPFGVTRVPSSPVPFLLLLAATREIVLPFVISNTTRSRSFVCRYGKDLSTGLPYTFVVDKHTVLLQASVVFFFSYQQVTKDISTTQCAPLLLLLGPCPSAWPGHGSILTV